MVDELLNSKILELATLVQQVKNLNDVLENADMEEDERNHLLNDLEYSLFELDVQKRTVRNSIGQYLIDCENEGIPVYINYFRVYKELV